MTWYSIAILIIAFLSLIAVGLILSLSVDSGLGKSYETYGEAARALWWLCLVPVGLTIAGYILA